MIISRSSFRPTSSCHNNPPGAIRGIDVSTVSLSACSTFVPPMKKFLFVSLYMCAACKRRFPILLLLYGLTMRAPGLGRLTFFLPSHARLCICLMLTYKTAICCPPRSVFAGSWRRAARHHATSPLRQARHATSPYDPTGRKSGWRTKTPTPSSFSRWMGVRRRAPRV